MTGPIDLFGITISEPMTSATDWLVTGVAWWLGTRLLRIRDARRPLTRPWGIAFWLIGFGALLGGASHAFATFLGDTPGFWIWKLTIYSIALSVTFALAGTINVAPFGRQARRALHGLNAGAFMAYAAWMATHSAFFYVVWHYVPIMLSIAALNVIAWMRDRHAGAPWIAAAVLVTLTGAVIQRSGLSLHRYFNHNDLYHVVQLAGLWLFYRGLTEDGRGPAA